MESSTAWGLLFIAIGVVMLLIMYSVIPLNIFVGIGSLLPLVFVAIIIIIGAILVFSKPEKEIEEVKE